MSGTITIRNDMQGFLAAVLLLLTVSCGHLANGKPHGEPTATPPPPSSAESARPMDCSGGIVKDDGTVETGYGFVPSAKEGIYVQRFSAAEIAGGVDRVCLCFLKTRPPHDIEFDVVFYESTAGRPAERPFATVSGSAQDVAASVPEAGAFAEVDVSSVRLPAADVFVGARWDPSLSAFLFVCTDTSEQTAKTEVFFREDRAPGWSSVANARDPIFRPHRAVLVRLGSADGG